MTGTQAIDRAAELVSLVVHAHRPYSFGELVAETGLAKSTGSRLLHALERHQLLERDGGGVFRPGALFAVYAARHEPIAELERIATPVLRRIGELTGETVNLAIPRGQSVVQIAQVDSRFMLGASNWVGVDVPAHCSALGKIFFAYNRIPVPAGTLVRRTPRTLTSRQLRGELRTVVERGYATTRGELEPGLDAVAVPVHGHDGEVVAALSVSGPDVRLADQLDAIGTLLVKEIATLSGLLGHQPEKEGAA
ncbi:MAG: IclR family transcriptional regulator [Geodermatophilaceae bacterium]|nr:IclR family transcriptional regulator [Geodermatophilaceae bacterium]